MMVHDGVIDDAAPAAIPPIQKLQQQQQQHTTITTTTKRHKTKQLYTYIIIHLFYIIIICRDGQPKMLGVHHKKKKTKTSIPITPLAFPPPPPPPPGGDGDGGGSHPPRSSIPTRRKRNRMPCCYCCSLYKAMMGVVFTFLMCSFVILPTVLLMTTTTTTTMVSSSSSSSSSSQSALELYYTFTRKKDEIMMEHDDNDSSSSSRKKLTSTYRRMKESILDDLDFDLSSSLLQQNKNQKQKQQPPWSIFYNIYIPNELNTTQRDIDYSIHIIQEQLVQVGKSYAVNGIPNTTVTLYYNTIGTVLNTTWITNDICLPNNMNCIFLQHYYYSTNSKPTFEEVTLQRVHDYCIKYPNRSIIYIHSKGSYHRTIKKRNDWYRRRLTKAVTHKDCLHSVTPGMTMTLPPMNNSTNSTNTTFTSTCHVCGLLAVAIPWIHHGGNMFTGRCSYIRQLLPLTEYSIKLQQLAPIITNYYHQGDLYFNLLPFKSHYLGLGRYANEHWVSSHPSIELCDMAEYRKMPHWKERHTPQQIQKEYIWSMFPNRDIPMKLQLSKNPKHSNRGKKDFFFLAGNMMKWIYLYNNTIPSFSSSSSSSISSTTNSSSSTTSTSTTSTTSSSSWVWDYYPDGKAWQDAYMKYGGGMNTIHFMLTGITLSNTTTTSINTTTATTTTNNIMS